MPIDGFEHRYFRLAAAKTKHLFSNVAGTPNGPVH